MNYSPDRELAVAIATIGNGCGTSGADLGVEVSLILFTHDVLSNDQNVYSCLAWKPR